MTIQKDVFLALLSLDSYNRGYGQGIDILSNKIGNSIIGIDGNDSAGIAQSVGFFAQSYVIYGVSGIADGTTVIAYRGTDTSSAGATLKDLMYGWTLGAGYADASQAQLALAFYQDVAQQSAFSGKLDSVILTGHSLGGGLAGFVSALSGDQALLFNYEPFGLAAELAEYSQGNSATTAQVGVPTAYVTTGEVLTNVRNGKIQETVGSFLAGVGGFSGWLFGGTVGNTGGEITGSLDQSVKKNSESVYGADLSSIELHSQALMVDLIWAGQAIGDNDWQLAAPLFFESLFNKLRKKVLPFVEAR